MTPAAQIAELAGLARRAALRASEPEAALGAGCVMGRILWQNPTGALADEPLEDALHGRHGPTLAMRADRSAVDAPPIDWLHVISEAYDYGGHTPLMEALLAIQAPRQRIAVAVTNVHTERFAARCAELGVPLHRLRGDLATRAAEIIALGRRADRIMLHIHPDDLGAALAARVLREEGRWVAFLNHADHVFSFGPGAADVVVEVSGFGWRLTRERRAARAQHFLGIPVPPPPAPLSPEEAARARAEGPILSIGQAEKYRPDGDRDFAAFLMTLMDLTERRVELIGPTPEDPWWRPVLARHGERLCLRGALAAERTRERLAAAACYVDSFPMTGGTALTQALMAGKTVFAPPNPAGGYSLADALRAPSITDMTRQVLSFLSSGDEAAEQSVIRDRIAREFGSDALARRLSGLENGAHVSPPDEMLAAAGDLDYYAAGWRRSGRLLVSLHEQALPSIATRLALGARLLVNPEFERPGFRTFVKWVLLGPPGASPRSAV